MHLLSSALAVLTLLSYTSATHIRLTTWNLRYDSQPDNITVSNTLSNLTDPLVEPDPYYADADNEKPWSRRRVGVSALLEFQGSNIICEFMIRLVGGIETDRVWDT